MIAVSAFIAGRHQEITLVLNGRIRIDDHPSICRRACTGGRAAWPPRERQPRPPMPTLSMTNSLRHWQAKGIKYSSAEAAIIAAHEVCDELNLGRTLDQVASTVMSNSNLDGFHAGYFVGASIRAYCPKYVS